MGNTDNFRSTVLECLVAELKQNPLAVAAWEGGSAANGTSDSYSDIDLVVVGSDSIDRIFDSVEAILRKVSKITHKLIESKQAIPGYFQRVYFLKDSPKHFFVDIGVFLKDSEEVFAELLVSERHGTPVVHFDRLGLVEPRQGDSAKLKERHKERLSEIKGFFPVYRTEVLKELDREHPVDAFAFYFAMVRLLVEAMGIVHRPFQFDFGLRYLHRAFPKLEGQKIEYFLYVKDHEDLKAKVLEVESSFEEVCKLVQDQLES